MKNMLSYLIFALVPFASSVAFSAPRFEDPCFDHSCADGEVCEVLVNDCAECPPTEPGQEPVACDPCNTEGVAVCVPAPLPECASDNDCNGDDVCVTYTFGYCSGSAGGAVPLCDPDDSNCVDADPAPEPEPEACVEETESICVPKYAAPCQSATDCGPGFTCETPEVCACSGSGTTCSSDDPNCKPAPPEEECTCAPSEGDAYCQIIPVECDSDSDCQNGFSCVEEPQFRPANQGAPCQEGDNCMSDPIPTPISHCLPAGYDEWISQGSGTVDGRRPESAERKGFFNGGNTDNNSDEAEVDGCQVSQSPTGLAGFSFLLLGLMFGTRRKRK